MSISIRAATTFADAMTWLNEHSGAVTALATIGTVLFTAAAAVAAWRAISSERRLRRSKLRFEVRTTLDAPDRYELLVWNVGATAPLFANFSTSQFLFGSVRQGGGSRIQSTIEPGEHVTMPLPPDVHLGYHIVVSRIDADGKSRTVRRWYRPTSDTNASRRSDLRLRDPIPPKGTRPKRLQRRPSTREKWSRRHRYFELRKEIRRSKRAADPAISSPS